VVLDGLERLLAKVPRDALKVRLSVVLGLTALLKLRFDLVALERFGEAATGRLPFGWV